MHRMAHHPVRARGTVTRVLEDGRYRVELDEGGAVEAVPALQTRGSGRGYEIGTPSSWSSVRTTSPGVRS